MSPPPEITSLINALSDPRDGLRSFAMRRLIHCGLAAVPALLDVMKIKNDLAQESAAIALITIGEPALPYLLAAMQHEDRAIRWGAAWVLSAMPPEVRAKLPSVRVPGPQRVEPVSKASESGLHGVWSDSWLTKVRERLQAQKVEVLNNLTPPTRPARGAC